jgi:hypothetical protein
MTICRRHKYCQCKDCVTRRIERNKAIYKALRDRAELDKVPVLKPEECDRACGACSVANHCPVPND